MGRPPGTRRPTFPLEEDDYRWLQVWTATIGHSISVSLEATVKRLRASEALQAEVEQTAKELSSAHNRKRR